MERVGVGLGEAGLEGGELGVELGGDLVTLVKYSAVRSASASQDAGSTWKSSAMVSSEM